MLVIARGDLCGFGSASVMVLRNLGVREPIAATAAQLAIVTDD